MISILMPVYNTASYLPDCLDSICNQTYRDWELIAIDDFSTDDSRQILEDYSRQDPRIQWLPNEEKGIIGGLRTAYEHSQGNMIHRMDSDDIMPLDKLENLHRVLIQNGPGVVATGMVQYFSTGREVQGGFLDYAEWINQNIESDSIFRDVFKECPIASPAWLIYREDLVSIFGIVNDQYPEDYDLVFRMYVHGIRPRGCKKVVHYWRDWPDRASRTKEEYADQLFFDLKIHYFLHHAYNSDRPLIIWGAGRKGKKLFRKFRKAGLSVEWVTQNQNKIGQEIYGTILEEPRDDRILGSQVIVAVSSPVASEHIRQRLEQTGGINNRDFFFFC